MAEIRTVETIRRSPSDVFAYATVPGNWPQWHPSSVRVTGITDRSLEVGESCEEEFVVAGRRGSCTWTARERVADRRWIIETETQGGRATIVYTLSSVAEGTRFERVLRYRMPNPLLAVLDVLVLRRRIRRESAEATRRLKRRLEDRIGSVPAYEPSASTPPGAALGLFLFAYLSVWTAFALIAFSGDMA